MKSKKSILWIWCFWMIFAIAMISAKYSRKRGTQYRNSLMRMQYHAWDFGDVLDSVLSFLKNILVPSYGPQSRISEFLFFFDFNNNGSNPFLGLNISQRDAAYVSHYLFEGGGGVRCKVCFNPLPMTEHLTNRPALAKKFWGPFLKQIED